jgi:hypothetical protein
MKRIGTPAETGLLVAGLIALAVAVMGPAMPQFAHYHAFADQRVLMGVPCAFDVISNLTFAVMGAWGLWRVQGAPAGPQRQLAILFFAGLLVTTVCSTQYHLQPNDMGLAVDRMGMVLAFAGLTGLAVADRVSGHAGVATARVVLMAGLVAVGVWVGTANLLPWAVLQGGGMLLVLAMALRRPVPGAWGLPLVAVIAWYCVAKVLELNDHAVFDATRGWVSGHTLKHVVAALSAWPVITLMHNVGHVRLRRTNAAHA